MSSSSSIDTGRIAVLLAVMAIIGLVFIALFYGLLEQGGGPFGTLNDLCMEHSIYHLVHVAGPPIIVKKIRITNCDNSSLKGRIKAAI